MQKALGGEREGAIGRIEVDKAHYLLCSIFIGRPRGRIVDSRPRRFAAIVCHAGVPKGRPRFAATHPASNSTIV